MLNTIEWIKEITIKNHDKEFITDIMSKRSLTFGQFNDDALRIGAYFNDQGFKKGDKVALVLNNSLEFSKLYFAFLFCGIIVVPLNPVFAFKDIDYILNNTKIKGLIVSKRTFNVIDYKKIKKKDVLIYFLKEESQNNQGDLTEEHDLKFLDIEQIKKYDPIIPFYGVDDSDTMAIVYTSGTTSMPNGVVHRIKDLFENAKLFNTRMGIKNDNRFYGILAMSYLGGYYNLLILPWVAGASVVLAEAFNPRLILNFWEVASEYKVNTLWLVPTIMSILLEMDKDRKGRDYCCQKIELALCGTAPLPISLRNRFESAYGIKIFENYGLSETLFITTNSPTLPVLDGSVGQVLPQIQLGVVNEKGEALDYEEEGEIQVCTPFLMQGYYDYKSDSVKDISVDSWFPTGDIGYIKSTGELFITGRKKDLIIKGGINISPASIENLFFKNEEVVEAAAIGVPHSIYGEELIVVIKIKPGTNFDEIKAKLLSNCKEKLGLTSKPADILQMDEFPKSSSGKIQKNKIRELLIEKLKLSEIDKKVNENIENNKISNLRNMIPGRIKRNFKRVDKCIIEELKQFPTSIISDVMNRLGMMDNFISSLIKGRPFCGSAFTVEEIEAGNLMSHAALELVQPGDILVIDAKGTTTRSCWGGLQTFMAKKKGVVGIVVNGTVRDYEDIQELGMPVYAKGVSPGGPMKGWGGNINYPIACGNVVVNAGDVITGDDDGVVVIPKDLVKLIAPIAAQRIKKEKKWFKDVENGISTIDAVGLRIKYQDHGLIFE